MMNTNFGHIHTTADWEDTVRTIKSFMKERGFLEVVPEEHIPELSGVDYNDIEGKTLRFFLVTKSIKGWTGIFEDGGQNAEKELAQYISKILNRKTIWTSCSSSTCNYLYSIFDEGEITEELARGDAYDYDEKGQLKYFNFYNEGELINFLKILNIPTISVTYEEILRNINNIPLTKDDLVHIAFRKDIKVKEEDFEEDFMKDLVMDDEEEGLEEGGEKKSGFFNRMMNRLTQPIWDKLGKDMLQFLPLLQKAQEMAQLAKPLMEQGLKGELLRNHPYYQRLVELEKEITEELRNSPYYTQELEDMIKQGMGLSQKVLKAYDPLEEEIKKLNYSQNLTFSELALIGEKLIDLSAGIKIDRSGISIKRIDKAISWAGVPRKADPERYKIAVASLIGEIIIKNLGGDWVKFPDIIDSYIMVKGKEVNPFRWYEEKLIKGEKTYLYEKYNSVIGDR
jgi:hypothetical protein